MGELPFAQIGLAFGRSEGWARVVYYRAKQRLRDQRQRRRGFLDDAYFCQQAGTSVPL